MSEDGTPALALETILAPGGLVVDRDGDGLAETVRARVVLGPAAGRAEYAAAADLAARLGLASMAVAPGLAVTPDDLGADLIPVFVGRAATLDAACPPAWADTLHALAPGDGLLAVAGEAVPALLVGGADEAGLAAAATAIATSSPILSIDAGLDADAFLTAIRAALRADAPGGVRLEAAVIRGEEVVEARVRLVPPSVVTPTSPMDTAARERLSASLATLAADLPCALVLLGDEADGDSGPLARVAAGRPWQPVERVPVDPARTTTGELRRSLAGLYGPAGLCLDSDGDLLPDHGRVRLELPADMGTLTGREAIDLAGRIGLETLGLTLPLASASPPVPDDNLQSDMVTIDVLPLDDRSGDALGPGEGEVRVQDCRGRGRERGRVVVRGGDEAGRARAIRALAALDAAPLPGQPGGGVPTVQQVEEEVHRLCALVGPDPRAAAVLVALDAIPDHARRAGDSPLAVRLPPGRVSGAVRAATVDAARAWGLAQATPLSVEVTVEPDAQQVAAASGECRLGWEVDTAWTVLSDEVFPGLHALPPGADWEIDVRVSEPAGRREQIRCAVVAEIEALGLSSHVAGPGCGRVHVRPAYRQGRAWLLDEVVPHLRMLDARAVTVRCRPFEVDGPCLELPIRWLQELHPVDELMRDRLALSEGAVRIELEEIATTYEVEARDADGTVVWQAGFDALYGARPYLPGFPEWGSVHPCTGCVCLLVDGQPVIDRRIAPDPERAWDTIQGTVLPALRDHVHRVAGTRPRPQDQPFFGSLTLDVWLSEDDALVGVREERESPLESLHEDIYFGVLDYCSALLGHAATEGAGYLPPWVRPPAPHEPRRGARLWTAPGPVVPRIHRRDGRGGALRWQLTETPARVPALSWHRGEDDGTVPLVGATGIDVRVVAIRVAAAPRPPGDTGREARHLVLAIDGPAAERVRAVAILRAWARLQTVLPASHDHLSAPWGYLLDEGEIVSVLLPALTPLDTAAPAVRAVTETGDGAAHEGGSQVPWDRVLVGEDIEQVLTRLRGSPRVHAYEAGRSARGRPSYAVEVTAPRTGGVWSRAKGSAWKCTLLLNARHHANEASSTSALLRLAELLALDPAWCPYLDRVNVVLIPYENPDGAALHDDLHDEHPTWMLHAGRYNADGLEFTSAYGDPLTPHGEARVLPALWHRWAPDIVSDDHGFPSHEWVQPFAGHSNPWFRSDWIPQGLIYAFLSRAVNPRYPRHAVATDALRARMVRALAGDPVIRPLNRVYANRYRTYLHRWLPGDYPAPYDDDVLLHVGDYDPEHVEATRASLAGFAGTYPGVTTATLVTEVADETAQGRYMAVCAHAHLVADRVLLQYLYDVDAPHGVRWERTVGAGGVTVRSIRPRPALPRDDEE